MATKYNDQELNSLIYKAIVPKGLRPTKPSDIEAMLDAIGGQEPSDGKLQRMLRKVRGEEPIGVFEERIEEPSQELTREQQELVAFFRARGEEIPPEIQAKLDEMRKRAKRKEEEDEADHGH